MYVSVLLSASSGILFVFFARLITTVIASPASSYVSHEKRDQIPSGWRKYQKMEATAVLQMKIALKQSNLDRLHEYVLEVSDPTSGRFGQHWNAEWVAKTFAPSEDSLDAVINWLVGFGIDLDRISRSQSLGWLHFDTTVNEAERLLKTEYSVYAHESGQSYAACSDYSIPEHLQSHVDFITPTVHFDAPFLPPEDGANRPNENHSSGPSVSNSHNRLADRDHLQRREPSSAAEVGVPVATGKAAKVGLPTSGSLPKLGGEIGTLLNQLENCDVQITPDCLRALYQFPPNFVAAPGNSFGIVEYTPQSYLPSDLDLFFANFSSRMVGQRPILDSIDGGALQTFSESFGYNAESDLDLEYAMTLVYPQEVTLYQAGDFIESASFNNFLDAIDASYCTFEGGDDPSQDSVYPDLDLAGYKGPKNCGGFTATKVIATSYGYNEADLTPLYERRQCAAYAKLGLQGITVLYSSGDYGVAGTSGQCVDPVTLQYNNGSSGLFNPSFPGTCPYVTSVGATQIAPGASVTAPEKACDTRAYSGGGFSNVFPLPDYQANAVEAWFDEHPPPYSADRFNNSQRVRGYPDVSANGANYVAAIDGTFNLVYGTSASTPTFGSIVTLINEARLFAGQGSVGFLNPTLYANSGVMNDITAGSNPGCGTDGFSAATGWDPVTGLGTPNFPRMLKLFLELP